MSNHCYEICEKIIDMLSESESIKDFCQKYFSKNPKFYLGLDSANPPSVNDAPFVLVMPESSSLPDNISALSSLFVGCAITDTTSTTIGAVTKMAGLKTIEDFERLIYDAIDDFLQPTISEFTIFDAGEARYMPFYPEFHSQRSLKITSERD